MIRREQLEEGRKIKQRQEIERQALEENRKKKLEELRNLNISQKYITDLERYKVK